METVLGKDLLQKLRTAFYNDKKNVLAQNVCSRMDPIDATISRKRLEDTLHVFNHKVDSEGKPVTNQKNSGRCWIFACLNVIRLPFVKHMNIEDFEFSQGYIFYWDKIERCNFFLNNIVAAVRKNESIDGRLLSFFLADPVSDGGQWDMLVNLINKHGLMPKKCFPETWSCETSGRLNQILRSKLREYSKAIRELMSNGGSDGDIQKLIEDQMSNIYRIVGICLGIPNDTFTWSYYDKNKACHTIGPITPMEFYEKHVKPIYNVDDKVCLVTDPRPNHDFGKSFTIDYLGNVVGGRQIIYNNQPVETLLDLVAKSIKDGEAVWFGCDVGKRFASKQGIQDLTIHDYSLVFDVDVNNTISKADRLMYGDSAMTHAMVFTAVNVTDCGDVTKLRVENSWGEDRGEKGYLVMTKDWFKEYVYEVVVDKKHISQEIMEVYKMEPIVLPPWDPMGTLAKELTDY